MQSPHFTALVAARSLSSVSLMYSTPSVHLRLLTTALLLSSPLSSSCLSPFSVPNPHYAHRIPMPSISRPLLWMWPADSASAGPGGCGWCRGPASTVFLGMSLFVRRWEPGMLQGCVVEGPESGASKVIICWDLVQSAKGGSGRDDPCRLGKSCEASRPPRDVSVLAERLVLPSSASILQYLEDGERCLCR